MKTQTTHHLTYTLTELASQLGYSGALAYINGDSGDGRIHIEVQYPEVECEPK